MAGTSGAGTARGDTAYQKRDRPVRRESKPAGTWPSGQVTRVLRRAVLRYSMVGVVCVWRRGARSHVLVVGRRVAAAECRGITARSRAPSGLTIRSRYRRPPAMLTAGRVSRQSAAGLVLRLRFTIRFVDVGSSAPGSVSAGAVEGAQRDARWRRRYSALCDTCICGLADIGAE